MVCECLWYYKYLLLLFNLLFVFFFQMGEKSEKMNDLFCVPSGLI